MSCSAITVIEYIWSSPFLILYLFVGKGGKYQADYERQMAEFKEQAKQRAVSLINNINFKKKKGKKKKIINNIRNTSEAVLRPQYSTRPSY